jgi:parallel beta-helix repeat protein
MPTTSRFLRSLAAVNISALAASTVLAPLVLAASDAAAERPGPSARLFKEPYYACTTNYYVSLTGSDANSGTSPNAAWQTLQHANNALPQGGSAAGTCINVAPGTYNGVSLSNGGNLASAHGYVVYRCTSLDACTITGNAGIHGAEAFETAETATPPNYLMLDGFILNGSNNSSNGVGVSVWNGNNGTTLAAHHIWILNSEIEGFGQSGIGAAASEYYYFIHNRVFDNSNLNCSAQGSGIAINIMHSVPGYQPTADDMKNPNPMLGPTWVVGSSFFHNVVAWNVIYNNALTQCGTPNKPTDTDGNGLIFDSNLTGNGDTQNYLSPSLTAFNVVYNNGGGGIHLFFSADVTVANNTCYNNDIDPGDGGSGRACMDDSNGYSNTFINNIAVGIPMTPNGGCAFGVAPYAQFNSATLGSPASGMPADTWSHNITQLQGGNMSCWASFGQDAPTGENLSFQADTYSCTSNKCATNPGWTAVGTETVGTETTPPVAANFGLLTGSPAIGYGLTEPYLPAQSVDAGACYHTIGVCPK